MSGGQIIIKEKIDPNEDDSTEKEGPSCNVGKEKEIWPEAKWQLQTI